MTSEAFWTSTERGPEDCLAFSRSCTRPIQKENRKMKTRILSLVFALSLVCAGLQGAVLFSNGAPDLVTGYTFVTGVDADDFGLGLASSVTGVRFFASSINARFSPANFFTDFNGNIDWVIYNDNAGMPGIVAANGNVSGVVAVDTGTLLLGLYPIFQLDFDFNSPVALSAGSYWLELQMGGPANNFWATTNFNSGNALQGGVPANPSSDYAFDIIGNTSADVPEPSGAALVGLGMVAGAIILRWARTRLRTI